MTDTVESRFRFRPFVPDADQLRLIHLLRNIEVIEHAGKETNEVIQLDQLAPPGHNPSLDRWVVESPTNPDELIAFGAVLKDLTTNYADIFIAVHPAWRGQGISTVLVNRLHSRASELNAKHISIYADT